MTTGIHTNNISKLHTNMGYRSSCTVAGMRECPVATGTAPEVEWDHMAATSNMVMCTAAATMETVVIETEEIEKRLSKLQ